MDYKIISFFFTVFLLISTDYSVVFGKTRDAENTADNESRSNIGKNTVAVVNGKEISRQELYDILIDTYGEEALDVLIRRTLIYQKAKEEGIKVGNKEIEQKVEKLIDLEIEGLMRKYELKDKTALEGELNKIGSSIAQLKVDLSKKKGFKAQAEIELVVEKILDKTITISKEEMRDAYDRLYGEKIEALQIVLKTKREAEIALEKLKLGADFGTLAANQSIDRASAARGGKMQPFSPKDNFGAEVARLKTGDVSEIIKSDYGYHIIKIVDKKGASKKSYKSVESELEKIIRDQKYRDRLKPWLTSLVESASITKYLEN
ncbi:MAG: peptidylprolyl isomerase [Candidatus Brocadiaceae bacterium]|nr:peptidylprolyl isomerase [Candidatus Brocadiaceae bacterium]